MRTRSLRSLTAVTALALTSIAAAACSSAPVRPLPNQMPGAATPSTTPSTAAPSTPPSTATPSTPPGTATPPPPNPPPRPCLGAVTYRIDASADARPRSPVCIAVGGVVRVDHLGPEGLSVNPLDKASCYYEAAVHVCRLVRTGTVRFTIAGSQGTVPLTVVVAKASSPPKPSPACLGAVTYTVDASESGPESPALCVKVGAVLRIENLGPEGLSETPSDVVSCWYEAGVHVCTFVRPGTVTFTITITQNRSLTVVAIT